MVKYHIVYLLPPFPLALFRLPLFSARRAGWRRPELVDDEREAWFTRPDSMLVGQAFIRSEGDPISTSLVAGKVVHPIPVRPAATPTGNLSAGTQRLTGIQAILPTRAAFHLGTDAYIM